MASAKLFTDEELENILFPTRKRILHRVKKRFKEVIKDYPVQTAGLVFAFGLLLGVAFSNGKTES